MYEISIQLRKASFPLLISSLYSLLTFTVNHFDLSRPWNAAVFYNNFFSKKLSKQDVTLQFFSFFSNRRKMSGQPSPIKKTWIRHSVQWSSISVTVIRPFLRDMLIRLPAQFGTLHEVNHSQTVFQKQFANVINQCSDSNGNKNITKPKGTSWTKQWTTHALQIWVLSLLVSTWNDQI